MVLWRVQGACSPLYSQPHSSQLSEKEKKCCLHPILAIRFALKGPFREAVSDPWFHVADICHIHGSHKKGTMTETEASAPNLLGYHLSAHLHSEKSVSYV